MSSSQVKESLRGSLLAILRNNILDYWVQHTIDNKYGGFAGYVGPDNKINEKASKGIVLNTRILWAFSAGSLFLKDDGYAEIADRAYDYITSRFFDNKNGGVFWELDYKGEILSTKKQVYAQAFAIYALTEYYGLRGKSEALEKAQVIYHLLEKHSFDRQHGGYIEAFSESWDDIDDVRLSEKDRNARKTMNTHLHILEAYTNLYRVWAEKSVGNSLKRLINIFNDYFVSNNNHLNLFFSDDWRLAGNIISFGHDIEFSWLFTEAADIMKDKALIEKTRGTALNMVYTFINEAFDSSGGVINEKNLDSGHVDSDKHWWVQAEAVVGLVNAYQISGDEAYLDRALKLWNFIDSFVIDHEHGEWFSRVNSKGVPYSEDEKAGFWKCPYHNTRTCIEVISRLKEQ
jgi:mannobiose 2-epimerase